MKIGHQIFIFLLVLVAANNSFAQHHSKIAAAVNMGGHNLSITQEITFYNQSADSLNTIVLNDWNNAFSDKNSPLGKRFSDEFYDKFHMAHINERGGTLNLNISDQDQNTFNWERTEKNPDYIKIILPKSLLPGQKIKLYLTYIAVIPSDKFTKYGHFESKYGMHLKNCFLAPARYENHQFIRYSNENLDDIANALCNYEVDLIIPDKNAVTTDLITQESTQTGQQTSLRLVGENRTDFDLIIEKESTYESYRIGDLEVLCNLRSSSFDHTLKTSIIDRIARYTNTHLGEYRYNKIIISQEDYERNPFYGLNQLPKFMRPFSTDFIFEIKFLKTYLNNYLKNSLLLDARKDNWIYDAIQVYTMINYIEQYHPESKMMGSASKSFLLKGYKMAKTNFNGQYNYYYMLMARKNLDQALNDPKNKLIKYNVQIANKYKAGLCLKFLEDYLGGDSVNSAIQDFNALNKKGQTDRAAFEKILRSKTEKNIDWFFKYLIDSRENIDYTIKNFSKTRDSLSFQIKNKGVPLIPMPIFGIKDQQIVFKKWIETNQIDSTLIFERKNIDKLVLNYQNEVPEFNLRNNWKSLKSVSLNRPLKLAFFQDLEDPHVSQLFYVPTLFFNKYDGFAPGISFYNYSFFDKPVMFSINPMYSINTNSFIGSSALTFNQYLRETRLYNIRYSINGSYYHYAPDAAYLKIYPSVSMYFREPNYRDNRKQSIFVKYNIIKKETSEVVVDSSDNYSILNIKYSNLKTEITSHVKFLTDLQLSGYFGKVSAEMEYRKLFNDNRYFNARVFLGTFLYNSTNTQNYNFGVARVNDYSFDYAVYARSDSTGFLSQQYFLAQGGFKSFVSPPQANQWLATTNLSYSILWNWVDAYADFGLVKNKGDQSQFVYDSGIRINLVQDYFELFFPVYSSNGFEMSQKNYEEKIRFIFVFNPKSLINLFTRKWF